MQIKMMYGINICMNKSPNKNEQRISPAIAQSQVQPKARNAKVLRYAGSAAAFMLLVALLFGLGLNLYGHPTQSDAYTPSDVAETYASSGGKSWNSYFAPLGKLAHDAAAQFDSSSRAGEKGKAESSSSSSNNQAPSNEAAQDSSADVPPDNQENIVASDTQGIPADANEEVTEWVPTETYEYVDEGAQEVYTQPEEVYAGQSSIAVQPQEVQPATSPESQPISNIQIQVVVSSENADNLVQANTLVTIPQGSTAYDALVATGLPINARNTQYGTYIAAINGLAEKQYGGSSGWLYAVNGATPGFSAGSYELSDGDTVEWFYTT